MQHFIALIMNMPLYCNNKRLYSHSGKSVLKTLRVHTGIKVFGLFELTLILVSVVISFKCNGMRLYTFLMQYDFKKSMQMLSF